MHGILAYVFVSAIRIVRLANTLIICICTKSFIDDFVVVCDDNVDAPEIASIISTNKSNYWLLCVVLLEFACSLLIVVIPYYRMKQRQITGCSFY